MPSLRMDPLDGAWHLFAPERSDRPNAFGNILSASSVDCPFCPGNEHLTPPEVARAGSGDVWQVRVFANLYPAVGDSPAIANPAERPAPGRHEVIVEARDHSDTFERIEPGIASLIVETWQTRWMALADDPAHLATLLFHNEGAGSGESIAHPHSQIVGLPWLPPRLASGRERAAVAERCLLCRAAGAAERSPHLVHSNDDFVTMAPFSARLPYQLWIIPVRHAPNISSLDDDARASLAESLRIALAACRATLGTTPFNWSFQQIETRLGARFHWYVEIIPRITIIGGFEIASGAFINVVDPAQAAARLRDAIASSDGAAPTR